MDSRCGMSRTNNEFRCVACRRSCRAPAQSCKPMDRMIAAKHPSPSVRNWNCNKRRRACALPPRPRCNWRLACPPTFCRFALPCENPTQMHPPKTRAIHQPAREEQKELKIINLKEWFLEAEQKMAVKIQ